MDQKTEINLLELVKRNYEEIAADFDMTRKNCVWPELAKLAELVKDGDRVLDVGCGNGRLLRALTGKSIEYLGVDSSSELIEMARKNFPPFAKATEDKQFSIFPPKADQPGAGNFQSISNFSAQGGPAWGWQFSNKPNQSTVGQNSKFILGNILELDKIQEKDFDYVFCVAVLHHLPGENLRVEAIKQMKSKISAQGGSASGRKPGGKIILTVWNLWNQAKFRKLIFKFAFLKMFGKNRMDCGDILFNWKNKKGAEASRRYYHAFTKRELKKTAVKAGLKVDKLYKDENNYYLVLEN